MSKAWESDPVIGIVEQEVINYLQSSIYLLMYLF